MKKTILIILLCGVMVLGITGCKKEGLSEVVFELKFNQKTGNLKKQIIDKNTSKHYDYNVYVWNGDVDIVIDNKSYSLEKALNTNKITMDKIIEKANKDIKEPLEANDGGSKVYHYDTYTIIKLHTIDGNRDVYIGNKELSLEDVK